ncbi:MAG: hypothetical protein ACXWES_05805 [Solirubrobacterales bacterium]
MRPNRNRQRRRSHSRAGLRALAACVPAALVLWAAPSASALTVSGTVTPANLQAGAHSDVVVHVDFTGGQVKDLRIGLPPGLIGDPTATPKCTVAQLNANACPANTQVGEVLAVANILTIVGPVNVPGELFNLEPQPGEPARFGIVLTPPVGMPIMLQSAVELRPTDFGLDTVINDIPNTTLVNGDTTIVSQDITLYGVAPGTGKTFMRNPTYCTPATTNFSADSYATPGTFATGQASFTATGCGALPFDPKFSAEIGPLDPGANSTKAPVTTTIEQTATEAGMKQARVFLPPGLGPDLAILGLTCQLTDFQTHNCPANSKVGQAVATSPILPQALTGPLILVFNTSGVPDLGLDLQGPLSIQLIGNFLTTPTNGVLFAGLPDIPIAKFQLSFGGGPTGLLAANKTLCDLPTPVFMTSFDSFSGINRSGPTTPTITGCAATPSATLKLKKRSSRHPRMKLSVKAGFSPLRKIKLKLPKRLRISKRGTRAKLLSGTLPKKAVKARRHKLQISPSEGDGSLTVNTGKRGLTRSGKLPKKPTFKLTVTDAAGKITQLKLRPGK